MGSLVVPPSVVPPYVLKYLFAVRFMDGEEYFQPANDEPTMTEGGSSFTYVDRRDDIHLFQLTGLGVCGSCQACTTGGPLCRTPIEVKFLVDLTDGHFEINGSPFFASQSEHGFKFPPGQKFKLLYYRTVIREQKTDFRLSENRQWEQQGHSKQTPVRLQYHIGWETEVAGVKYRQTIAAL